MAKRPGRVFLGRTEAMGIRQRVYAREDCVEIDEMDYYDINRQRVYYEDVQAITRHRIFGWVFLTGMALMTGLFLLIAVIGWANRESALGLTFFIVASPFMVLVLLRLVLRVDVISVFGRRTKAEMHYFLRKGKAQSVYQDLSRRVRQVQERLAAQYASEAPRPAPPPLLPPPLSQASGVPPAAPPPSPAAPPV